MNVRKGRLCRMRKKAFCAFNDNVNLNFNGEFTQIAQRPQIFLFRTRITRIDTDLNKIEKQK